MSQPTVYDNQKYSKQIFTFILINQLPLEAKRKFQSHKEDEKRKKNFKKIFWICQKKWNIINFERNMVFVIMSFLMRHLERNVKKCREKNLGRNEDMK